MTTPIANTPTRSSLWEDSSDDEEEAYLSEPMATPVSARPDASPLITPNTNGEKKREEEPKEPKRIRKQFNETPARNVKRYRKLNCIDEGGYGVVYRVRDNDGCQYALKRIKFHHALKEEGFPVTALREIELLLLCDHPNIVYVYETAVGDTTEEVYMVMEYVEHDLKSLMDQRKIRFTAQQVKCLMLQLLEAVNYIHQSYLIHRDIKTQNLLLTSGGVLKLCDFGMARKWGTDTVGTPLNHVVTLPYRPPEGVLGLEYDQRADMWSVGCVFSEFLSNEMLFRPRTELELLTMHCELLGTPSENTWPGWNQTEFFKKWSMKEYPPGKLREKFPASGFMGRKVYLTEQGFDLLRGLLEMCPEKRLTAAQALEHPYFNEEPKPATLDDMKKLLAPIKSMHEVERKQREADKKRQHEAQKAEAKKTEELLAQLRAGEAGGRLTKKRKV